MFAPESKKMEYEKVEANKLLPGYIEEVQYEESRTFKGFKGKPDVQMPAVRFKIGIIGLSFPKYSRWMKFNTGEKSNLYGKYLSKLVAGIKPDMKFDLDHLTGMKVSTLWSNNGDFQNIEIIVPTDKAFPYTQEPYNGSKPAFERKKTNEIPVSDTEVPF